MSFTFKTTAMAAVISCIMSGFSPVAAQISPDIMQLLRVASDSDGGKNLDLVVKLAIAANPKTEADIVEFVATLNREPSKALSADLNSSLNETPVDAPEAQATEERWYSSFDVLNLNSWDGEAELSILATSGNTSQQSYGLAGKMTRDSGQFHHRISAIFDLNKNTGVKDKQKWGLAYKLDYDATEKLYLTGFAGYENDQFGAFRERITTSLGIGYPIIAWDRYSWKLEGGPSLLFTKKLSGKSFSSSLNAFASSIFTWTINERSEFVNTTIFFFGNESLVESKTALKVKINGALSSKFSYDLLHNRDAPPGRRKTDTVARAGLLYDF